ncbi:type II secretion system protein [Desulfonatronovibrio hydrogenovorans]|uniref:type II secretion system protein n=1 Tax=Desulfonatronovibrio hydrogenovorans TaxID=53245 RepID=UPI00068DB4A3|nr:prepilin-type N-terminal cleavage/methylation domain-containing protein [Desulfonatronovibrio hydrogenovorans]
MLNKQQKPKKNQQGFTLLEILVVVAIMGFLVAMVAPRFAGIVGTTEEVVCDSNQQRMVAAISTFYEQNNRYPNRLVNLVDKAGEETTGDIDEYRMPVTTRATDPDRGPATFSEEFDEHHWFQIHILSEDEADELRRSLGIVTVFNLNAYNYEGLLDEFETEYETEGYRGDGRGNAGLQAVVDEADQQSFMQQINVAEGLGVLMVGMGAVDTTSDIDNVGGAVAADEFTHADHLGLNDSIGRIVMGVGPENSLIREGMISTAGLCPADLSDDLFTWNHYSIILPRLEATVERMPDWARTVSARAEEGDGIIRTQIELTETERWNFATACPEGHSWPETDGFDAWVIHTAADYDDDTSTWERP